MVSIGELWQQRERKSTKKDFYFIQSLTSIGGCCAHKWRTIKFLQQSLPLPQKPRLQINQIVDCQEFLWIPKHPREFINFPRIPKSQIFNFQEFLQIPWISQIFNQYSSKNHLCNSECQGLYHEGLNFAGCFYTYIDVTFCNSICVSTRKASSLADSCSPPSTVNSVPATT